MGVLRDSELREAVHKRLLCHAWRSDDTLVVDELGVLHGAARVDIAVINGHIRGLELKAEADTLGRLPRQVDAYGQVVDRASLITTDRHLDGAIKLLPPWWGIVAAHTTASGVQFRRLRPERANPDVDIKALLALLWRSEALDLLLKLEGSDRAVRMTRKELYAELSTLLSKRELSAHVRSTLKSRQRWRDHRALSSCADLSPPNAK
jgi:hypothetical protein